jgi:hypothetical protein
VASSDPADNRFDSNLSNRRFVRFSCSSTRSHSRVLLHRQFAVVRNSVSGFRFDFHCHWRPYARQPATSPSP